MPGLGGLAAGQGGVAEAPPRGEPKVMSESPLPELSLMNPESQNCLKPLNLSMVEGGGGRPPTSLADLGGVAVGAGLAALRAEGVAEGVAAAALAALSLRSQQHL